MKLTIRQGVFETNSSSEHSISIVKKSNFQMWKDGLLYAKRSDENTECNETWGNFWSRQYYWSFNMLSKEEAEQKNKEIFEEDNKHWLEVADKFAENGVNPQYAKEMKEKINKSKFENLSPTQKFYRNMWISYEEYLDALRNSDCYSPFEHINETEDVVVFGTYFHS